MITRIVLKLPNALPFEPRLDQRIQGIRTGFDPELSITFWFGSDEVRSLWRDEVDDCQNSKSEVAEWVGEDVGELGKASTLVVFSEDSEGIEEFSSAHRVFSTGRLLPAENTPINEEHFPYLNTHFFNSHSPRDKGDIDYECFCFFPYGYHYRKIGLGPIDAIGHRIIGDFKDLRDRDDNHKLVLCFGGSSVFGQNVLHHQTFPARLEHVLNSLAQADGRAVRYSVLNFGIPGATVMNEMQRFVMFGLDLNADFVISHDGINDFFYAYTSDRYLQEEHGIVYQPNLEYWAQALFDSEASRENVFLGGSINDPTHTPPIASLRAFLRRKREFAKIVKGTGSLFIAGLQPFYKSKSSLSETEKVRISNWRGSPPNYVAEFQMIESHYQRLTNENPSVGADAEINFHQVFQVLDGSNNHFSDMVHMDVLGEEVIASRYADEIIDLLDRENG